MLFQFTKMHLNHPVICDGAHVTLFFYFLWRALEGTTGVRKRVRDWNKQPLISQRTSIFPSFILLSRPRKLPWQCMTDYLFTDLSSALTIMSSPLLSGCIQFQCLEIDTAKASSCCHLLTTAYCSSYFLRSLVKS